MSNPEQVENKQIKKVINVRSENASGCKEFTIRPKPG